MKNLLLCLTMGFLLSISIAAQSRIDRGAEGLNGPVKSVREEVEYLGADGKPDEHGRHLSRVTTYDRNGNKLEDERFYAFGKASYGKHVYTYDAKGRKAADALYQDGHVSREAFTYDDQPPTLADNTYWVNRVKLDSVGRVAEVIRMEESGKLFGRQVFKYEDGGRVVRQESFDSQGNPSGVLIKTFDEQGRLVSQADGDDPMAQYYTRLVYTYDERGNESRWERYDNKELAEVATFSSYELDPPGNWTKRTATYEQRDQPKRLQISYRTITYDSMIGAGPPPADAKSHPIVHPVPLNSPIPNYTVEARSHEVEGAVVMRVLVGEDGLVKQARVVSGLPFGLDEEAIKAACKLKFKPAMRDGQPIKFWVPVSVEFHLRR